MKPRRSLGVFAIAVLAALPMLAEEHLLNQPAPRFELTALSGQRVDLADLRGSIVVLHFGTGW